MPALPPLRLRLCFADGMRDATRPTPAILRDAIAKRLRDLLMALDVNAHRECRIAWDVKSILDTETQIDPWQGDDVWLDVEVTQNGAATEVSTARTKEAVAHWRVDAEGPLERKLALLNHSSTLADLAASLHSRLATTPCQIGAYAGSQTHRRATLLHSNQVACSNHCDYVLQLLAVRHGSLQVESRSS